MAETDHYSHYCRRCKTYFECTRPNKIRNYELIAICPICILNLKEVETAYMRGLTKKTLDELERNGEKISREPVEYYDGVL